MTTKDWLLLFICLEGPEGYEPDSLEPVHIMKGMFLFAMQSGRPPGELYQFEPYHYGPFSAEVYRDLDALVAEDSIRAERAAGQTWLVFYPTERGAQKARSLEETADPGDVASLIEIREYVVGLPFARLLREIYAKYPRFAARSLL
jgi:hypothetical protein